MVIRVKGRARVIRVKGRARVSVGVVRIEGDAVASEVGGMRVWVHEWCMPKRWWCMRVLHHCMRVAWVVRCMRMRPARVSWHAP